MLKNCFDIIPGIYKGSILSALSLFILTAPSYAADTKKETPKASDAAKRLESVLKKAGEQGLLQVEGQKVPEATPVRSAKSLRNSMRLAMLEGDIDCEITDVFDLVDYNEVLSFDSVLSLKSSAADVETLDDTMPIAKTYIALGLGSEVISLNKSFNSPKAFLLNALARVLEDSTDEIDRKIINRYSSCNGVSDFWNLVSKASGGDVSENDHTFDISLNQLQILEDLPDHLETIIATRLGVFAAEQGASHIAEQLLLKIEPKAKNAKLPAVKSDERLYFYALIRQLKGDPASRQIFSHLGQRDGLFRTRALQRLVEANVKHGAMLHESFADDLLSVRQQYKGQTEGREATVELIRHQLKNDKYIFSIEVTKSELSQDNAERLEAVTIIGDRIYQKLEATDNTARLFALNGYMHDSDFFAVYPKIEGLKVAAYGSAIDMNLPELALLIAPSPVDENDGTEKQKAFAAARLALKQADYNTVVSTASPFKSDKKFEKLLLQAAVASGDEREANRILGHMPEDKTRHRQEAKVAWRNGQWYTAKTALEAASGDGTDPDLDGRIAVANYVGSDSSAGPGNIPVTADSLDGFNKQITGDIALVKAYLTNG